MTRIELGGEGFPIPPEALPDGLVEGSLTPLTLTFNANDSFDKTLWTPFGFTVFTIMCVGAAGGRGPVSWYMLGGGTNAPIMLFTCGGAGGGGGMHIVSGLLADLGDISTIVVGQAGADAPDLPAAYDVYGISYNDHGLDVGIPGADGSHSAFGTLVKASGGKGGKITKAVISSNTETSWRPGGDGGDGGIGGSIVAGGGAAGGSSQDLGVASDPRHHNWAMLDGEQGFWDGIIGEGGGGGAGFTGGGFGVGQDAAWIPELPTVGHGVLSVHDLDSTNGGRGSFSYADSSKHGAKQAKPTKVLSTAPFNIYFPRTINNILPGGGGGARPTPLAKYGSRSDGYSPNGVVIVKLS